MKNSLETTSISMNNLVFRKPTIIYRSDACPAGIGGYNNFGRAWRWHIPNYLQQRATLNMLEHLSTIIGPWVDIIEKNMKPNSCILSMGDSTTANGWLRKSNFKESDDEPIEMTTTKTTLSRLHTTHIIENNVTSYTQWFPGEHNELANSLSRDFHIDSNLLPSIYKSNISSQTPLNLTVSDLPKEITCFLCSIL